MSCYPSWHDVAAFVDGWGFVVIVAVFLAGAVAGMTLLHLAQLHSQPPPLPQRRATPRLDAKVPMPDHSVLRDGPPLDARQEKLWKAITGPGYKREAQ